MHDERSRIEEREERLHHQRVKPAMYAAAVPLEVAAWQAPGEPVPFAEAAAAPYEPFAMGTPWGPPWGTTWFRMRGQVPAEFAGRRVEAVIDLGLVGDWPGNQAESCGCTAGRATSDGTCARSGHGGCASGRPVAPRDRGRPTRSPVPPFPPRGFPPCPPVPDMESGQVVS